jgi:PAS domain S-box-containing protein
VRSWNNGARRIKGYTETEILGRSFEVFYTDEDRGTGRPQRNLDHAAEFGSVQDEGWRVRADGSRFWASVTITALHDDEGDVRGFAKVTRDMTKRRNRERELEESERRHRTLIENFPDGAVAMFDERLRYTVAGGELLDQLDMEGQEVVGQKVHSLHDPDVAERLVDPYETALAGDHGEAEVAIRPGREVRVQTIPVRDVDGDVYAGLVVVQDVTELKERERRLAESNERLEQFAYAASHDLQEPLRMVSTYLQLIEDRYGDMLDGEGREFFAYAIDGAQRMREMIRSLLAYSRVTRQGQPLAATDARGVVDDAMADLQLQIEETEGEITIGDLPTVAADADQLAQVFRNLLSNALRYSGDEPPRVHVDAEPRDEMWQFSVHDEGIGIPEEQTDRIFEVFRRLRGPEEEGTGIGLALCEQIVDRHGGRMWVESEPGEGSTFYFTMPPVDDA